MHDLTLDRTTNADVFVGKEGFPDTTDLADWNLEQLRKLQIGFYDENDKVRAV